MLRSRLRSSGRAWDRILSFDKRAKWVRIGKGELDSRRRDVGMYVGMQVGSSRVGPVVTGKAPKGLFSLDGVGAGLRYKSSQCLLAGLGTGEEGESGGGGGSPAGTDRAAMCPCCLPGTCTCTLSCTQDRQLEA
jgi:hypothetical protein